jgi:AraC-like DNA-binding protein/cupin superfamily acireductone dioxygenase involved in methionine salvage
MQKQSENINYCEIAYDENFPVSYFTYTQGYIRSNKLHFHNGIEIGYCSSGSGIFFVENKVLPFSREDISVIFPDQPHIAQSPNESQSQWKYITFDIDRVFSIFKIKQNQKVENMVCHKHNFDNIIKCDEYSLLIKMVFDELETKKDGYQEIVKSLLWIFLVKLTRFNSDDTKKNIYHSFEPISIALNYIAKNYCEDVTISMLAKMCHLSTTHFRRVFKNVMEITPYEYLYNVRIKMATILLKTTDDSIGKIASDVGYNSITSFNRHFGNICGMTPSMYRRK